MSGTKARIRTSKLFLFLWTAMGLILLWSGRTGRNDLIIYLSVLAVLVWNRIDSRRRGYSMTLKTLGGTSLSVDVSSSAAAGRRADRAGPPGPR
jgi:hypothetical protein